LSVGLAKPGRKHAPLDLANIPTDARYRKQLPLTNPTLSSRRAPATNGRGFGWRVCRRVGWGFDRRVGWKFGRKFGRTFGCRISRRVS
jgi:hypothetical protein